MVKRALLVGCNYPGTESQLTGCINDVAVMKETLLDIYGFEEDNVVMMVDSTPTEDGYEPAAADDPLLPTFKNIVKCLSEFIQVSEEGDALFFHFSGHGGQIPSEDDDEELDGLDEVIFPTDFNALTDDTFKELLSQLPEGVTFTLVADSCRSGGLLDNAELHVGIGENQEIGDETEVMASDLRALSLKAPLPTAAGGREIPVETIMRRLAAASGHEVTLGTIRTTTYELFQEDANPTVKKYVKTMLSHMQDTPEEKWEQTYGEAGAQALQHLQAIWDDESIDNDVFFSAALNYESPQRDEGTEEAPRGKAILISGSEADQNSADMGTGGALSNAIQAVVALRGGKVTNKDLANEIRKVLMRRNLDQRPCLYCPADMLDANFICDLD
ncbi:hypothetical protein R1sor_009753 [Riccia sorocarpa]|uniref:Peptidase C14 caspase domain-containing protein n=1 Tax=Riccia sorocarpa TaxID=122646 RepID=A0ABD3HYS1_9MARC